LKAESCARWGVCGSWSFKFHEVRRSLRELSNLMGGMSNRAGDTWEHGGLRDHHLLMSRVLRLGRTFVCLVQRISRVFGLWGINVSITGHSR
jgi:hypothetical protein